MENKYKFDSFLSFTLGYEYFAANVAKVLNILEMVKITKVPKSPDYMLGVINLRGSVLPLIDLRLKFGMEQAEYTSQTCILVLDIEIDNESLHVGALVDSVQEVLQVTSENIQPSPNIGSKFKSEFIYGMTMQSEEFIMLLDMDRVFSTDELTDLKQRSDKINKTKSAKLEETG
ncbi:MAG: chemotaxis protein CheW [Candidatus Delongbacteria bacterium]|nr:chemotaxis protein CheW [Candidatus Delongbacteria bacterium]